jgi:hypothetical protein
LQLSALFILKHVAPNQLHSSRREASSKSYSSFLKFGYKIKTLYFLIIKIYFVSEMLNFQTFACAGRFVLCGCETRSLTLRERYKLKMSENRVMREIFWT